MTDQEWETYCKERGFMDIDVFIKSLPQEDQEEIARIRKEWGIENRG